MPPSARSRTGRRRLRNVARSAGEFLQASKVAYHDTVSNYVAGAVRTRAGRIGLGLTVLILAVATGFRIIGSAFTEEEPLIRVLTVWGASLWLFGFGHSAGIILRRALQPDGR